MNSFTTPVFRCLVITLLLSVIISSVGCSADIPANPSFALTYSDAKAALAQMRNDPKPLVRPLIIAGGYQDPGLASCPLGSPWMLLGLSAAEN